MRRLIGYSFFCTAVGMLVTLFIESTAVLVVTSGILILAGYELFCCG